MTNSLARTVVIAAALAMCSVAMPAFAQNDVDKSIQDIYSGRNSNTTHFMNAPHHREPIFLQPQPAIFDMVIGFLQSRETAEDALKDGKFPMRVIAAAGGPTQFYQFQALACHNNRRGRSNCLPWVIGRVRDGGIVPRSLPFRLRLGPNNEYYFMPVCPRPRWNAVMRHGDPKEPDITLRCDP